MENPLKADMIVGNDWHTGPISAMTRLLTPAKKAMGDLDPQTADKIENIPMELNTSNPEFENATIKALSTSFEPFGR